MAEAKNQLIRGLTLTDTTALVIGTVIGSGVFLKAAVMAQEVGTPKLVLPRLFSLGEGHSGCRSAPSRHLER